MSVAVLAWVPAVPAAAAVVLSPGDNIQAAVDAAPEGEIFTLRPGAYRHQIIRLKDRQQLLGQLRVVLSGAMILRERHREADLWVVGGLPDPRRPEGRCRAETDLCRYREDLFVDGVLYQRVESLEELAPGLPPLVGRPGARHGETRGPRRGATPAHDFVVRPTRCAWGHIHCERQLQGLLEEEARTCLAHDDAARFDPCRDRAAAHGL